MTATLMQGALSQSTDSGLVLAASARVMLHCSRSRHVSRVCRGVLLTSPFAAAILQIEQNCALLQSLDPAI